ncbi:MAG: RNA methyltransferase [Acidobacteriota bacterium]
MASSSSDSFVFGFHPVREALRHRPHEVAEVWIAARQGKRRADIEGLCRRHDIRARNVDPAKLDARAGGGSGVQGTVVHNGFGALVRAAATCAGGGDPDLVVLLEDIQDPRNLGAILRVCEGAGVGRVLVRDRGSAPVGATAVKTSAGAAEYLDVERITNSTNEILRLRDEGFWIYGADAAGTPPWSHDLTGKVVLVLGGESSGLRRRTRDSCDALVGLPMRGRVDSLNVATAASALLYDALRQRLGAAARGSDTD